jgi:hypothetical protein
MFAGSPARFTVSGVLSPVFPFFSVTHCNLRDLAESKAPDVKCS